MKNYFAIGKPLPRVDALEKVTGKAIYGDDLRFSNLLYGKVLRSKYAHAKILNINIDKAKKLPGVRAIVVGKEMSSVLGGEAIMDYPFLAINKVRYVGEPVAAVAAINEEIAEEALDLIEVTYEELPAIFDPLKAMEKDAPLIHENMNSYKHIPVIKPIENSNICHHVQFGNGDTSKGFSESDHVFEDTFTTQMVQHGSIEPHVAIAQYDPTGKITVWVNNDGPHRLRKDLAKAQGVPLKQIRIINPPYIGGGFGGKGGLKEETICIALAQKTQCRPVKILLSREEVFTSTIVRHPSIVKIKTGVKKDGTILAREVKVIYDTGAYAEKGPTVTIQASTAAAGPYKIPHVKVDGYCVYTNKTIAGAYRGYGIPQVAWAHESQMDIIADKLGIDPIEIRLKNILDEEDICPTTRQVMTSIGLKECIEKIKEDSAWNKVHRQNIGRGIACAFKNTKTPSGSATIVKINSDGSAEILTSSIEEGQGVKTILAQILAEELKVPLDNITVSSPDTDLTPFDASSTSSRTTFHMGNAVKKAAEDAKKQILTIASEIFKVGIRDLRIENGKIYAKQNPSKKLSISELITSRYGAGMDIIGRGSYYTEVPGQIGGVRSSQSIFWMYAAHEAEVKVDPETGRVEVLRIRAAHDVGKAINPLTCEGQIDGGVVHGIGPALFEEMIIGKKGEVLNPSFLDYKIPTALDIPEIIPFIIEKHHKEGPYGAKGIGEMTVVPTAAAISNAIYNAIGVRIKDLPITPEKILKAFINQ